jgi:hypothetical protein
MVAPHCIVCCESTRGAAAITVASVHVFDILRLVGSIIGVLLFCDILFKVRHYEKLGTLM